jgi:hypothetical protein
VTYEEEPQAAERLWRGGGYEIRYPRSSVVPVDRVCPAWSAFARSIGVPPWDVVFCHGRTSPSGRQRLIVIDFTHNSFKAHVIRPGTLFTRPQLLRRTDVVQEVSYAILLREDKKDHVRMYAGQPDPADPAHLTIKYEKNGEPGIIDGWLTDEEWVRLRVRTGPGMLPEEYYERMERLLKGSELRRLPLRDAADKL